MCLIVLSISVIIDSLLLLLLVAQRSTTNVSKLFKRVDTCYTQTTIVPTDRSYGSIISGVHKSIV